MTETLWVPPSKDRNKVTGWKKAGGEPIKKNLQEVEMKKAEEKEELNCILSREVLF